MSLKEEMFKQNITVTALANKTNIQRATISKLINNKTIPTVEMLQKIAIAIKVEPSKLFDKAWLPGLEGAIRKERFKQGLTRQELRDKIGCSFEYVVKLEQFGIDYANDEMLKKIARVLNTTVYDLYKNDY